MQIVVPGTTTTALLQQLLPDTPYNVGVVALYSDGEGPAISDNGKTCKNQGHCVYISSLKLKNYLWPHVDYKCSYYIGILVIND